MLIALVFEARSANSELRPAGPAVNRPSRQARIELHFKLAPKAQRFQSLCRSLGPHRFAIITPELTFGVDVQLFRTPCIMHLIAVLKGYH